MRIYKNMPLLFENNYVKDDELWFSAMDFNGLFKANLQTGMVEFIGCFPGESTQKRRLHYGNTVCVDGKLYFIPWGSNYLHGYDMDSGRFVSYELKEREKHKYSTAIVANDIIYFFPVEAERVLKFCYKTGNIQYLDPNEAYSADKEIYRYQINIKRENNFVYFTLKNDNVLMVFDITTERFKEIRIGDKSDRYLILWKKSSVLYLKKLYTSEIVLWNVDTRKEEKKINVGDEITNNTWLSGNKWLLGNNIAKKGIQMLDLKKMRYKTVIPEQGNEKYYFSTEVLGAFAYKEELYYGWAGNGAIYSAKQHEKCWNFILTDELKVQMKDKMKYCSQGILHEESDFWGLDDYVEYLKNYGLEGEK